MYLYRQKRKAHTKWKKPNRQHIKKGTEKKRKINLRNILVFTNMPKEEIQNY